MPKKGAKGKGKGKGKGKAEGKGVSELAWGQPLGQMSWEHGYGGDLGAVNVSTPVHPQLKQQQPPSQQQGFPDQQQQQQPPVQQQQKLPGPKVFTAKTWNRFKALEVIDDDDDDENENENESAPVPGKKNPRKMKMPRMPKEKARNTKMKFGGFLATLGDEAEGLKNANFFEQGRIIATKCQEERHAASLKHQCSTRVTFADKPINAMPSSGWSNDGWESPQWQKIALAVDSGAAETVIPHDLVISHQIMETEASRQGVCYASATGQPIPNLGEQKLPLLTSEGSVRGMTFQVTPVSRPLGSVKRICKAGHRVVFDEEGSYIQSKTTGEVNWMREEQGNYILDLWVLPDAPFGRQP